MIEECTKNHPRSVRRLTARPAERPCGASTIQGVHGVGQRSKNPPLETSTGTPLARECGQTCHLHKHSCWRTKDRVPYVSMFGVQKVALKILPLVMVLWATLAIVGSAVHLVNESEAATQGAAMKTGLGLCAVSVALLMSTKVRRIRVPELARKLLPRRLTPLRASYPKVTHRAPRIRPPTLQLLQVSRT